VRTIACCFPLRRVDAIVRAPVRALLLSTHLPEPRTSRLRHPARAGSCGCCVSAWTRCGASMRCALRCRKAPALTKEAEKKLGVLGSRFGVDICTCMTEQRGLPTKHRSQAHPKPKPQEQIAVLKASKARADSLHTHPTAEQRSTTSQQQQLRSSEAAELLQIVDSACATLEDALGCATFAATHHQLEQVQAAHLTHLQQQLRGLRDRVQALPPNDSSSSTTTKANPTTATLAAPVIAHTSDAYAAAAARLFSGAAAATSPAAHGAAEVGWWYRDDSSLSALRGPYSPATMLRWWCQGFLEEGLLLAAVAEQPDGSVPPPQKLFRPLEDLVKTVAAGGTFEPEDPSWLPDVMHDGSLVGDDGGSCSSARRVSRDTCDQCSSNAAAAPVDGRSKDKEKSPSPDKRLRVRLPEHQQATSRQLDQNYSPQRHHLSPSPPQQAQPPNPSPRLPHNHHTHHSPPPQQQQQQQQQQQPWGGSNNDVFGALVDISLSPLKERMLSSTSPPCSSTTGQGDQQQQVPLSSGTQHPHPPQPSSHRLLQPRPQPPRIRPMTPPAGLGPRSPMGTCGGGSAAPASSLTGQTTSAAAAHSNSSNQTINPKLRVSTAAAVTTRAAAEGEVQQHTTQQRSSQRQAEAQWLPGSSVKTLDTLREAPRLESSPMRSMLSWRNLMAQRQRQHEPVELQPMRRPAVVALQQQQQQQEPVTAAEGGGSSRRVFAAAARIGSSLHDVLRSLSP